MLSNYLKIAFRNLLRDKYYSGINIMGLALGMGCGMLIVIYLMRETSYERHFSDNDRIYRVSTKFFNVGDFAGSSPTLPEAIREEMSWVEHTTQVTPIGPSTLNFEGKKVNAPGLTIIADSTYFDVFDYKIIAGNKAKMLADPMSIVLDKQVAINLFNSTDVIGKMVTQNGAPEPMQVTGVIDTEGTLSHLTPSVILAPVIPNPSDAWYNVGPLTFIKTKEALASSEVEELLSPLIIKNLYKGEPDEFKEWQTSDAGYKFLIFPLNDVYFEGTLKFESFQAGDREQLYMLAIIGTFIIFIACFNYINLSTARSLKRMAEVGVRKTLGSTKVQLIFQFILESGLVCLIAAMLAIGSAELLLILLRQLLPVPESLVDVLTPLELAGSITLFTTLVALLASVYPAVYIARFNPIQVLKSGKSVRQKTGFRNVLVILQFTISSVLILMSVIVSQQMDYLGNKDLGFDQENTVIINNVWNIGDPESFSQKIRQLSGVESVSLVSRTPGDMSGGVYSFVENDVSYQFESMEADHNMIEALDLLLIDGSTFNPDLFPDTSSVILNQAAVAYMQLEEPIGKEINGLTVIGVVNDFNYQSLREEVQPLLILNTGHNQNFAMVRFAEKADAHQHIDQIRSLWNTYNQGAEFDYTFLDQNFEKRLKAEAQVSDTLLVMTVISIFITLMGLVGLCAYTIERKTKEIGVRVVLGATWNNIITLIGRSFSYMVIIAFLIAAVLTYFIAEQWLGDFAFRMEQSVWVYLAVGATAILLTWVIISIQSVKTTFTNPVNALRDE